MNVSLACPDWEARIRSGRSLIPDLPLNRNHANRAVAIFDKLRIFDVPGSPPLAQAGGDWFRDIVRALFGAWDPAARTRFIREVFTLVPKKNAKTTQGALLMLTALLMNERPSGTMILTAPVQDVAELAFDTVQGAIELDPVLGKKLHVRSHLKTIVHRETKAELQIMTFDPSVLTGQKPIAVLIDELHVVSRLSKAASALRQLRGGMIPYPEAFLVMITTQSEEAPSGVFRAELMKARMVRDGKLQAPILPVLYEFPRDITSKRERWMDPANWHMVTPNVGRSVTIERLQGDMAIAQTTGEDEFRAWASQHLDIEVGLALLSDRWQGVDFWEACADESLTFDTLLERCEVIDIGIDGGGLRDLMALTFVGRETETGQWLAITHAWAHPSVLEHNKEHAQAFLDFEAEGDLTLVAQIGDDIDELVQWVVRVHDAGLLDKIGVDPAGIGSILDALADEGIPAEQIVGISQGWKMVGAIKTTERRLASRTLRHGGQRLFTWCVGNCKVEPRGNAYMITKQASGMAKIDPAMALFDAVSLMALNPQARQADIREFIADPIVFR
jgi:phage terminase large subunit-like protein